VFYSKKKQAKRNLQETWGKTSGFHVVQGTANTQLLTNLKTNHLNNTPFNDKGTNKSDGNKGKINTFGKVSLVVKQRPLKNLKKMIKNRIN
jgi:hypothetical protein